MNRAYGRTTSVLIRINIARLLVVPVRVIVVIIVIVWVIVRGAGRVIVPWVKPPPEAVDEDEDVTTMKVGASLVPVAMPVGIVSGKRVILHERLSVCCC